MRRPRLRNLPVVLIPSPEDNFGTGGDGKLCWSWMDHPPVTARLLGLLFVHFGFVPAKNRMNMRPKGEENRTEFDLWGPVEENFLSLS